MFLGDNKWHKGRSCGVKGLKQGTQPTAPQVRGGQAILLPAGQSVRLLRAFPMASQRCKGLEIITRFCNNLLEISN